jgi:hypothetical protein
MKIKYSLKKLYPGIYLCKIEDMYDLTMTFCRVQEFYESPFKQIRGKKFTIIEFMALYAKENEGVFSYPQDWAGFNVPGPIVAELYDHLGVEDINEYDNIITDIHDKIRGEIDSMNYYLIGSNSDKTTITHECCHALYFLDAEYKKNTNSILKKLRPSVRTKAESVLYDLGYDKSVLNDELQAYFSTEFHSLRENVKFNKKELENVTDVVLDLKKNFKKYKEKIGI